MRGLQERPGASAPYVISGIPQVGIGVANAEQAFAWYRRTFGTDVPIFRDTGEASLMTRYTAGRSEERQAVLALNMQGGGGFEIWQYTSRTPAPPPSRQLLGDTGVFAPKVKSRDVAAAHRRLSECGVTMLSGLVTSPDGRPHFYVADPFGNLFEVVSSDSWFATGRAPTGGVAGATIGVTDIDRVLPLYRDALGRVSLVGVAGLKSRRGDDR